ncbi:MAG TPA: hypothetical protein VF278_16620, partial [Pirellulales bacterium]
PRRSYFISASLKIKMDRAAARQRAIDHLTALVADCNDALGAADIWADYAPEDRAISLALFRETRDAADRLLGNLQADLALSQSDWRRVIPPGSEWADVYKALFSSTHYEGTRE